MTPLPIERLQALFPLERPAPKPQTFELGLVLGGTVGVGSYTAGALDFLLEALHAWHARNPPHRVSIPFAAGASGGAVCSTLLALISSRQIQHIRETYAQLTSHQHDRGNMLFDIWVNRLDVGTMLTEYDIQDGPAKSLLNATVLDRTVSALADYANDPNVRKLDRPYFTKPFRWAVTLANTRGIPYRLDVAAFEGFEGAMFEQHDDFARFAMPNGIDLHEQPDQKREDEFWVVAGPSDVEKGYASYEMMGEYSLGSAAFPAGFPARGLERPIDHYRLRPLLYAQQDAIKYSDIKWPQPMTDYVVEAGASTYEFVSVDGGMFNVDPISIVHRELAGLLGRNPREPDKATRGLFMIDPLASMPRRLEPTKTDFLDVLKSLVGSAIGGARYLTADMQLLGDPNCFSRFQLVPHRHRDGDRLLGSDALAGSALGAFGGFVARDYRVHDFMLGRHNMENYLRRFLTLRGDNALFDKWNDDDRLDHACDANGKRLEQNQLGGRHTYYLPVIPLVDGVGGTSLPDWPRGAFDPADLEDPADDRLERVLHSLTGEFKISPLIKTLLNPAITFGVSNIAAKAIIARLKTDLKSKKLI